MERSFYFRKDPVNILETKKPPNIFGNATMLAVCAHWFLVHFVPILSINIYNVS